jgi:hypothetical protein
MIGALLDWCPLVLLSFSFSLCLLTYIEVCFWNPDEKGTIRRDSRVVNGRAGLSQFHEVVLHQGRAETFFLNAIRNSYGPIDDAGAGARQHNENKVAAARPHCCGAQGDANISCH